MNEDEEPEDLARDDWVQLLNEKNGVYSLKPWDEVMEMKANKVKIALAWREIVRQAWSEWHYNLNHYFSYLNWII